MLKSEKGLIEDLVQNYQSLTPKEKSSYNEANTVNVFIRPLFEALGWDFSNIGEVEAEKLIAKGRVDYVFKIKQVSKFCVEVKSIRHELNNEDREQAISYAYNKGVTWAILTNFARTQVYNAEIKGSDLKSILFLNLQCQDYVTEFEDLRLISKESAINSDLDKKAEKYGKLARRLPVEKKLYEQMTKWRGELFNEVYGFNKSKGITLDQTDQLIQKLFSRLIFIRTAEDRGLAGNHPLVAALHQWDSDKEDLLGRVREIFRDFAHTFDSDIFPQIMDPWQQIWVNDYLLAEVLEGLYKVPGDYAQYYFDVIEPDVLGQVYEQYLGFVAKSVKPKPKVQQSFLPETEVQIEITAKKEKRKRGGIYYTPKWVTDYIVKQTINRFFNEHTHNEILNMKVIDPACGSGSFLIRAYDELLLYHAKVKGKPVAELNWQERIGILTRNIFGVDLDPQAVEIARLNLLIRALAQRDLLPSLENNIRCGNSLIFGKDKELEASLGKDYKAYKPFNWEYEFADIIKSGGFDIVIGNPPYVMELRDNKEIFRQLKVTPFGNKYYEPKMDIFYFFIELGIDLLKPDSYLGFIVQQYWVSRAHASKLRKKIFEETTPLTLVDLNEYQVFQDAPGQHNMITVLKKSKAKDAHSTILQLKDTNVSEQDITKALASEIQEQNIFSVRTTETSQLYHSDTDKVYVIEDTISQILNKLSENSFNIDNKEIQQGLVTPQHFLTHQALLSLDNPNNHKAGEGIFVLSKLELGRFKLTENEKALMRPFHYAEEIDAYYYDPEIIHYLIYTPLETAKDIESNPKKYPNITSHLDKYQSIITSDRKPYGIHRARQQEWFEDTKKIVCVRKTRYPKFVVVPEAWYGDQAVLIIRLKETKHVSPYVLTAILNSKVAHFYLFQQKRQGNQLQVDKEVLLHFPFPKDLLIAKNKAIVEEVSKLSKRIANQRKELESIRKSGSDILGEKTKKLEADILKLKNEMDSLVYELYDLNKSEIEQIERLLGALNAE